MKVLPDGKVYVITEEHINGGGVVTAAFTDCDRAVESLIAEGWRRDDRFEVEFVRRRHERCRIQSVEVQ